MSQFAVLVPMIAGYAAAAVIYALLLSVGPSVSAKEEASHGVDVSKPEEVPHDIRHAA